MKIWYACCYNSEINLFSHWDMKMDANFRVKSLLVWGVYISPLFLGYKLHFGLCFFTVTKSYLPQKQTLSSCSVNCVCLRKQHGCHTCGFQLNDGYCMNAALSWVHTDESSGSVWGEITYWFFCAMVPHWFNIHRHIEASNELYQSVDTFLPPQTLWLQHDFLKFAPEQIDAQDWKS